MVWQSFLLFHQDFSSLEKNSHFYISVTSNTKQYIFLAHIAPRLAPSATSLPPAPVAVHTHKFADEEAHTLYYGIRESQIQRADTAAAYPYTRNRTV